MGSAICSLKEKLLLKREWELSLQRTKLLEIQNKKDWRLCAEKVKILLIGQKGAGVSTIRKQLKVLYGTEFSSEEKLVYKKNIHSFILSNFRLLLATNKKHGFLRNLDECALRNDEDDSTIINKKIANLLKDIWDRPQFHDLWTMYMGNQQVYDALSWYMSRIDEISDPTFVPNYEDILRAPDERTSGTITESFVLDKVGFELYDANNLQGSQQKWLHCFDDVTTLIFVVDSSDYGLSNAVKRHSLHQAENNPFSQDTLGQVTGFLGRSDIKHMTEVCKFWYNTCKLPVSRLYKQLALFEEIANSKYFRGSTTRILFLNKSDLFRKKLQTVPLCSIFPNFKGPKFALEASNYANSLDYDPSTFYAERDFIVQMFMKRNHRYASNEIYYHWVCALDIPCIKVVFNATKDIILKANLCGSCGF